jgi:hypothetical protein
MKRKNKYENRGRNIPKECLDCEVLKHPEIQCAPCFGANRHLVEKPKLIIP